LPFTSQEKFVKNFTFSETGNESNTFWGLLATIFHYFSAFALTVSLNADFIFRRLLGCESTVRETRDQIMDGASVALCRRDER
jgi:hypothetical protein